MRSSVETPRSGSSRLIAAATVAAAMLVTAAAADGSFPGRNGRIAFSENFDCRGEGGTAIGSMRPDGSGRKQLSECRGFAFGPNWSPDGRSLLYSTFLGGTWLIASDGSEERQTSRGRAPSFASDGLHYAYMRSRGPVNRIWRARIDGSHERHLRAGQYPRWSPDGRTIAYYRKGVWTMNARTGERLRRVAAPGMTPLDWSPDGRRLLGTRDGDIYTVRADGSGRPRRLTRTPARSETEAAWSPNGRRIVIGATTEVVLIQHFILTVSPRGSDEKVIWTGEPFDEEDENISFATPSVSWQPLPD